MLLDVLRIVGMVEVQVDYLLCVVARYWRRKWPLSLKCCSLPGWKGVVGAKSGMSALLLPPNGENCVVWNEPKRVYEVLR